MNEMLQEPGNKYSKKQKAQSIKQKAIAVNEADSNIPH
jgi:hypothetical protein